MRGLDRYHAGEVADLKSFLQGPWRVVRKMVDRRAGLSGRLDGVAAFEPAGAGLVYRESGLLRLGGYEGRTARVYRYAFAAPGRAEVTFEDGKPFHVLDLTGGAWSAIHRCRDDLYRGAFRATAPDAWEAVWQVTGPRKDHTLTTRYRRNPASLEK